MIKPQKFIASYTTNFTVKDAYVVYGSCDATI